MTTAPPGTVSLLAVETSGNQAYVYRSQRLRESIGASALISAAAKTWVEDVVKSHAGAEVVVATSGKAVILGDRSTLVQVLRRITTRALSDAPGLDVTGGIVDIDEQGFYSALSRAFARIAENRSGLRGSDSRFRRLPIIETCNSTGLPAAAVQRIGSDTRVLGLEAMAKRSAEPAGWEAMAGMVADLQLDRRIDALDQELPGSWLAVVHADGSGMGQLFLAFDRHLEETGHEQYLSDVRSCAAAYRRLSTAIERCTVDAWQDAARSVAQPGTARRERAALVPVLLGGDDITVVTDGSIALDFAEEYVRAFARLTASDADLYDLGVGGATAGASIVWTKPGYPYRMAYDLAERRLKQAKRIAKSRRGDGAVPGVIDVFVLYDSLADDVDRRAPDRDEIRLTANPYTVDRHPTLRGIDELRRLVAALAARGVPSSQIHELRSLITTTGLGAAERRLDELKVTSKTTWDAVHPLVDQGSVMLLDAIDVADAVGAAPSAEEES